MSIVSDLAERLDTLTKAVLSEPVTRIANTKVTVRPVTLKGKAFFQLEYQHGAQVSHRNVAKGQLCELYENELDGQYRQIVLCTQTETRQYVRKTDGSYKCTAKGEAVRKAPVTAHDRKKEYILAEGENIPALVDLGVFTQDFKIVKSKYDKYKQINRFIELVDDAFRVTEKKDVTILDFGCGKSYLTFLLYYYFTVKRGVRAKIIGYDLKEDVVAHCNEIAQWYGYENLRFVVADVTRDVLYDEHIDMIVTLHACDTATDYALHYAIERGVKAKIIGYDLKEDVVENCNAIAQRYGYENLRFVVADVTRDVLYDEQIDMIVTLHACDTATDYALHYAIEKGVEHIFSVPCCQHEVNSQIQKGGDFDILLAHGLLQERFSALLTDAIRAAVLEDKGYTVDVIEFIDFAHSPKNIMLRCVKNRRGGTKRMAQARALAEKYQFRQTLLALTEERK